MRRFRWPPRKKNLPRINTIRLQLEELEGRCLLSGLVIPNGAVTIGSDGNIWFPEWTKIGQLNPTTGVFREFSLPDGMMTQRELISGPDGNLWFPTDDQARPGAMGLSGIAKMNPTTGSVQEFQLPSGSGPNQQIVFGPDGNIWFADWKVGVGYFMGQMDPTSGLVKDFPLSRQIGVGPNGGITVGPDGNLWFADSEGIGKFNPLTGALQMYPVGFSRGLTVGPEGAIWFNQGNVGPFQIGRLNPSDGSVREFAILDGHGFMEGMTTGPDGNIWFTGGTFGNIDPATDAMHFLDLPPGAFLNWGIVTGPDGNLWFSYGAADSITGETMGYLGQFNPRTGTIRSFALAPFAPASAVQPPQTTSADNSLSALGATISGISGIAFNQAVALLTPQSPIVSNGVAYQASVDWGDGNTSWEVLTVNQASIFSVSAGHTYQDSGTYSIKIMIAPNKDGSLESTVTVFSTALITELIPLNM
jgi:streptogramin lyase